ncbi:hypothetical protein BTUL_0039g00620 [Botrytis tulipae]|uniref:Uncharacterized protein n=1 Tax=Botrytis tulipae TaxID=87230 RepID=A0A4Z1ETH1_9HELO|nr:hypothetical protein BTUL_0039g00620 [Botrytis tulipae]
MKLSQTFSILTLLVVSTIAVAVPQDKACTVYPPIPPLPPDIESSNLIFEPQQCLTEGTFCSGFAGPVGTCCDGLLCENAPGVADDAHCIRKKKCLAKGATCVSIAGPQGTCCSGNCTFVAADYSICK